VSHESATDHEALVELIAEIFGPNTWSGEHPVRPLSSVDVVRFVVRIERTFGITIPDQDLRNENFASIVSVLALINKNRGFSPEEKEPQKVEA
jgi:hypothetical protein